MVNREAGRHVQIRSLLVALLTSAIIVGAILSLHPRPSPHTRTSSTRIYQPNAVQQLRMIHDHGARATILNDSPVP